MVAVTRSPYPRHISVWSPGKQTFAAVSVQVKGGVKNLSPVLASAVRKNSRTWSKEKASFSSCRDMGERVEHISLTLVMLFLWCWKYQDHLWRLSACSILQRNCAIRQPKVQCVEDIKRTEYPHSTIFLLMTYLYPRISPMQPEIWDQGPHRPCMYFKYHISWQVGYNNTHNQVW